MIERNLSLLILTLYSETNVQDFAVLNEVQHYSCPASDLRIIVSNGIPDHDIQFVRNPPRVQNWMVSMPLTPSYITDGNPIEPSPLGYIAMSLNGVPVYGAQEGGGTNAVEFTDGSFRVPYHGHAAPNGDWHYHSGEFGRTTSLELDDDDITSRTLMGFAADGFPIYGPLDDPSGLDECNGIQVGDSVDSYRYHARKLTQVNETVDYCNGNSSVVVWKYVLGCFMGNLARSAVADSTNATIPADCERIQLGGRKPERGMDRGMGRGMNRGMGRSKGSSKSSSMDAGGRENGGRGNGGTRGRRQRGRRYNGIFD